MKTDRRGLLAGGAAAALGLAGCGGGGGDGGQGRRGEGGDLDIVSFAATLEAVEGDFWRQVVARDALGAVGGTQLALQVERNERRHLEALEGALRRLGAPPAPRPRTDFRAVFAAGAPEVLRTAATLENLAAAAYLGQAGRIQDRTVLATAIAVHSVEARQAAAVNALAGRAFRGAGRLQGTLPDGAFAEPAEMEAVLRRLDRYRVAS